MNFETHGITFLLLPSSQNSFPSLKITLNNEKFGAFGPMNDLSGHWEGVKPETADFLQRIATRKGLDIFEKYPDAYNGVLPRLEAWEETPQGLHLTLSQTTFLTWAACNGNTTLPQGVVQELTNNRPQGVAGAHHLPVSMSLVTSDGFIVLVERGKDMLVHPGVYGNGANGNIDLVSHGEQDADLKADGSLNITQAMIREAGEELGLGLGLNENNVLPRALMRYSDRKEWSSPALIFSAKTPVTLAEVMMSLRYAHPTEGKFEIGGSVLAVPVKPVNKQTVVAYLRTMHMEGKLAATALAATLLALEVPGSVEDENDIELNQERPAEILKLQIYVHPGLGNSLGY